ncbi:LysR substrate-binding domain-containing protein [Aestuariivirga sp.]|uniref:LysR substrate-binding domain-containing protein n=1 Tax=Aestuariivirga sp. TaxID=2650926 RepID=UPI0035942E5D
MKREAVSRLPSLNALRCFEAAARSGSFSRAAEELNVTQSAVSHQVRQLEQWFGLSLFDRLGRQTIPTPKGQELARSLAEAFDIMAAACRRLSQSETGPALTIAALPSIATIWLIPRLSVFFADHPEVSVKVIYAFADKKIDFEECDIAILWGPGEWEGCRSTRLLPGNTVPVCNPGYLEREGPFDVPQSILGKPLLHDTDRLDWQNWMRHAGLKHAGAAPGPIFQDFNLLRASALAGQGIALCPRSLIADDLDSGRLVQLFDTAIKLDYAYCIIEAAHGSGQRSDAIDIFKSWLLDTAKS